MRSARRLTPTCLLVALASACGFGEEAVAPGSCPPVDIPYHWAAPMAGTWALTAVDSASTDTLRQRFVAAVPPVRKPLLSCYTPPDLDLWGADEPDPRAAGTYGQAEFLDSLSLELRVWLDADSTHLAGVVTRTSPGRWEGDYQRSRDRHGRQVTRGAWSLVRLPAVVSVPP